MADRGKTARQLKQVFQKYDKDGNGTISKDELGNLLKVLGGHHDSDIQKMFTCIDKNGDNMISYDEFVDWICNEETARAAFVDLNDAFQAFCNGRDTMDGRSFMKLCKDTKLICKAFGVHDVDLVFSKFCPKGQRSIPFDAFQDALRLVADKKGKEVSAIIAKVVGSHGPQISGTQADYVRFHDDKNTYTGTHVNGGPEAVAKGHGTATQLASQGMQDHVRHHDDGGTHAGTGQQHARSNGDTRADAAAPAPATEEGFRDVFNKFCGREDGMDGRSFAKMCDSAGLYGRHFSKNDGDIVFSKFVPKGQRKLGIDECRRCLRMIAEKSAKDFDDVLAMVVATGGPQLTGTPTDYVRFHDDKNTFTGTHVHGGPEAGAMGHGTATQLASRGMRRG